MTNSNYISGRLPIFYDHKPAKSSTANSSTEDKNDQPTSKNLPVTISILPNAIYATELHRHEKKNVDEYESINTRFFLSSYPLKSYKAAVPSENNRLEVAGDHTQISRAPSVSWGEQENLEVFNVCFENKSSSVIGRQKDAGAQFDPSLGFFHTISDQNKNQDSIVMENSSVVSSLTSDTISATLTDAFPIDEVSYFSIKTDIFDY
jgi:hypothetical protein